MKRIPVYKGVRLYAWAKVSDEDYPDLVQYLWRDNGIGYVVRYDDEGRSVLMHRQVMGCARGDGREVDHRDGDPRNNQRPNLRIATRQEQTFNTRGRSKYGRGVTLSKNGQRFIAQGKVNGKVTYLGTYDSAGEAARVAAEWRREHHGEFAVAR